MRKKNNINLPREDKLPNNTTLQTNDAAEPEEIGRMNVKVCGTSDLAAVDGVLENGKAHGKV
uniref:Uncharacterized protein n=1 Tax=Anopheles minimus TaxID=112268 RepID=A0A182WMV1_9DIPT